MPANESADAPLTQFQRVLDTFVAPAETFRDILRSASWWLPYVILAVSTLCASLSIWRSVGWEQVAENQLQQSPVQQAQLDSLDPAARAARIYAVSVGYRVTSYAYPALVLLIAVLAALVLWGSFTFGLGSRATFSEMLCLWMYASLPRAFTALITAITLWFGVSPESFDLRQPAGTNLGYYLSGAPAWVRTLLSFFDIFGLWSLALLIVGGAIIGHVKKSHAALIVLGWWSVILIVSVGISAAFS